MADIFSYRADRTADKAMEQVIKEGEPVFEVWRDPNTPSPASRPEPFFSTLWAVCSETNRSSSLKQPGKSL